jgi:hypothetical protein
MTGLLVRAGRLLPVLALAAALGATGCGSKSAPGVAGAPAATRPAPARKPPRPEDIVSPNMVAAVANSKEAAATVQVKFELAARPQVGQPLEVALVIIPVVGTLEQVSGKVEGEEGLDVVSGATIAPTDKPAMGTPIHHSFSIIPRRDGVFVLNAVIATQAGGQTQSEAFSIPIIAGSGAAAAAAAPEPAHKAATRAEPTAAR